MFLFIKQIKSYLRFIVIVAMVISYQSCVEPYEGLVEGFDDVLVVNTVITNEYKRQEVILKRSYRFEEEYAPAEEKARVMVTVDNGNQILFEEVAAGRYLSIEPFAAEVNSNYMLSITTKDGNSYESNVMQLPTSTTSIEALYAERITNDKGVDGIGVFVDTFDPSNNSKYYRYDFIETYKVIAPLWSPYDVVLLVETRQGPEFNVIAREREEQVCYGSARPSNINLVNTINLSEDRLTKHNLRFISSDNYILSHRYSILARQYVQSAAAFAYYETLKDLIQSSTAVFSEDQPGFLAGNIFSVDRSEKKVVGFFEVATVDEKRIFFSYEDFYPGEELPPYAENCYVTDEFLLERVKDGTGVYYGFDQSQPIKITPRACGDCTVLGSNKVPEFWQE